MLSQKCGMQVGRGQLCNAPHTWISNISSPVTQQIVSNGSDRDHEAGECGDPPLLHVISISPAGWCCSSFLL